ncbi:hypothetical protein BFAG_03019 [Bacteroides fragilis 3_1_12]|uniref:Uncharacterized protein n=1 Tax=Bacteroides fragilis 3_1_12 TaxID=457424 RepID=A0ABN0BN98_BACFG|nr:hypothetical protein BFAG_03019 [Bacteroides fragilis 3_1_12]
MFCSIRIYLISLVNPFLNSPQSVPIFTWLIISFIGIKTTAANQCNSVENL